jgi:hypothetical protein
VSTKNQSPSLLQRMSDDLEAARASQPEEARTPAPPELPEIDESTTGVVFVHGIGEQVRAEILLEWSRSIVRAVADWSSASPETKSDEPTTWKGDRVVRTGIDFEGSDLPLVTIRLPGTTEGDEIFPPQTWVMTEARWAQEVQPPSLETMIDWCGPRGVVASVVNRIVERSMAHEGRADSPTPASAAANNVRRGATRALAEMGLSAIVSVVVTFGLLGYGVVRAVAGLIPYKPLQEALARVSLGLFLTTWWGDVYVLLDDPVQAANIRGQVAKSIRALRGFGCKRIVVVAHSGGTIVSYMTLSDPAFTEYADTFITHGQAIQMGRNIHRDEGAIQTSPGARIEAGQPLRVGRWHDFHASHDPAPAGQLAESDPDTPRSAGLDFTDTEVWNRMSIADDHGGYFANDEEFVDGLLSEIETVGRQGAASRFVTGRPERSARRRQRVFILALWKRLMFVIPIIAIMAAFLTPSQGLIPELRDAARQIVTFVPGSSELAGGLHALLPPPGNDTLVTASATLFAVLYGLAIIQAAMPIGRSSIWGGWLRAIFRILDTGVFAVGIAIAVIVRSVQANDTAAGVGGFVSRFGDAPLRNAVIIILAMFLFLFITPLRERVAGYGGSHSLVTRLLLVVGALAILSIAAYGPIVDAGIRMVVAATVVALAMFQVLGKVGTWRWERWDDAERAVARERSAMRFRRRWIWVEFLALGAIATTVAFGIALDSVELLRQAGIALAALLAVLVIADVVVRKPVAKTSGAATPMVTAGPIAGSSGPAAGASSR